MDSDTGSALPDSDVLHTVRFYAGDASLLAEAAAFADTAAAGGGAGIVIATQAHCEHIRRLVAAPGGVILLDAEASLERLLAGGWPDEGRLRAVFGPLLARVGAGRGPVHVFNETAALLCAQGRYQAALRLEQLWGSLAADYRCAQFCAYPWRLFPDASQAQVFEDICAEHGRASGATVRGPDLDLKRCSLARARREQEALARGGMVPPDPARRRDEAAVRPGESLHRVGPDGTILWADRTELRMLGYRWEEYVGRHIASFHVDAEMVDLILDTLLSGGVLDGQPARLRCKDGSIRHVRMRASGRFENGKLLYGLCFMREDAAGREHAAAMARRDGMLLGAPVAVALLMAPDLRFRHANRHFRQLFGRRELVGKRLVEALPQLRYGAVEAALEQVFETGEPYCQEALALVLPDAGGMPVERFFKLNLEALYDAGGRRHGVMAVAVEVGGGANRRGAVPAVYNTRFRTKRRST